jgi:hypothetical protein
VLGPLDLNHIAVLLDLLAAMFLMFLKKQTIGPYQTIESEKGIKWI